MQAYKSLANELVTEKYYRLATRIYETMSGDEAPAAVGGAHTLVRGHYGVVAQFDSSQED